MSRTHVLLITLLSCALSTWGQDFALFNADSRKLFTVLPEQRKAYSMAFDSVTTTPTSTVFHQFKAIRNTMVPSQCGWWGDAVCFPQDLPTWFGASVEVLNTGEHVFQNALGEPITMRFNLDPLDTTIVYTDAQQKFLMVYDQASSEQIMGEAENIREWTLLHRDLLNNPISSPVNGASVIVGETLGLVRSVRIDSFPAVLEVVELIGQSDPERGLHALTQAMIHDYQPGDEIQTRSFSNSWTGPPWLNYDHVTKHTILQRTDSPDSVTYLMDLESFDPGTPGLTVSTISQRYSKHSAIAWIPYERNDGTGPTLSKMNYCGLDLWTYSTYLNQGFGYCPEENCWGPVDTNGPPPTGGSTHVLGIGPYATSAAIWQPTGYSTGSNVIYFKKNGIPCGQEMILTISDERDRPLMTMVPNPTDGVVTISADEPMTAIRIRDVLGRIVYNTSTVANAHTLALGETGPGTYHVQVEYANGRQESKRLQMIGR